MWLIGTTYGTYDLTNKEIYLQVRMYYVSFPLEFRPEILSPNYGPN